MARTFVGLDVGHHMVRAVALRREGRSFAIVAHAEVPRLDEDGTTRPLRAVVKDIQKKVPLGRSPVVSIGDLETLVRYVGTIPLPPDRLQRLLRLELLQAIEASELAADSFPVPLASDELIHCCVLTHPTHAHEAIGDLVAEGLSDPILHVSSAAVYNVTVPLPPIQDEELALLVDIGSARTNVALFGDRRLLACRQLAIGGDDFTAALTGGKEQGKHLAEQRKIVGEGSTSRFAELGRATPPAVTPLTPNKSTTESVFATSESADKGDEGELKFDEDEDPTGGLQLEDHDDQPKKQAQSFVAPAESFSLDLDSKTEEKSPTEVKQTSIAQSKAFTFESVDTVAVAEPGFATQQIANRVLGAELTKVAESLYGQLASSLAWFRTQIHARQLNVTKVFLTGGGASLDGLEAYLQRRFNLPVKRFDPCENLTGRTPECPHVFATAIGLAIAAANSIQGTVYLDLTPDTLQRKRLWRTRLLWPYVAAASILFAAVLACLTMLNNQTVAELNIESFAEFHRNYDEQKKLLDDLQREREGLSEDLRAIASRIYAGRDALFTIRALKEQTEKSKELWITTLETVDIGKDSEVINPASATSVRGMTSLRPTSTPSKDGRRDTAIDRGAVDITGSVKFDTTKTDVELNNFFESYKAALDAWKPADEGAKLFRESRVVQHVISHEEVKTQVKTTASPRAPKTAPTSIAEAGRFPFKLRFFYQPTELGAITSAQKVEGTHQP
jgi:Tfp pilus assembly PilM family ATPase